MNLHRPFAALVALFVLAATVVAFTFSAKAQVYAESAPAVTQPDPYLEGQMTAVTEAVQTQVLVAFDLVLEPHVAFRTMANMNHLLALLARSFGAPSLALYFDGRASVFDAVADLMNEPPTP